MAGRLKDRLWRPEHSRFASLLAALLVLMALGGVYVALRAPATAAIRAPVHPATPAPGNVTVAINPNRQFRLGDGAACSSADLVRQLEAWLDVHTPAVVTVVASGQAEFGDIAVVLETVRRHPGASVTVKPVGAP